MAAVHLAVAAVGWFCLMGKTGAPKHEVKTGGFTGTVGDLSDDGPLAAALR